MDSHDKKQLKGLAETFIGIFAQDVSTITEGLTTIAKGFKEKLDDPDSEVRSESSLSSTEWHEIWDSDF